MENISKFRTELMGASILWIMFFHSRIDIPGILIPLKFIKNIGYAGVDIFFLLSGLGLTFSISKDNSLINFYWKRMIRVVPTYWACLFLTSLIRYIVKQDIDCHTFLLSLFGLDFWVLGKINYYWYIPSIMACYVFFPGIHFLALRYGRGRVLLTFGFIAILSSLLLAGSPFRHLLIFAVRVPVFILGIYIGFLLLDKQKSILSNLYFNGIVLFLSITILGIILLKTDKSFGWYSGLWFYPTIVMAFPVAIMISNVLSKVEKNAYLINPLRVFGLLSLEIYLIHAFIFLNAAKYFPIKKANLNFLRIPEYIFYAVVSFVLAKFLHHFLSKINWEVIHNNLIHWTAKNLGR